MTITLESLDIGSSFSHIWYISRTHGYNLYMKVTGLMSRSLEQKGHKCLSSIDQLRSTIFTGTRKMASQTTRRGWSRLRLESKLVLNAVVKYKE